MIKALDDVRNKSPMVRISFAVEPDRESISRMSVGSEKKLVPDYYYK